MTQLIHHSIAFLVATIAGLAGNAVGGPGMGVVSFVGIFTALELRASQRPAYRVTWGSDIIRKIRHSIASAIDDETQRLVEALRSQPRGALSRSLDDPRFSQPGCCICKRTDVALPYRGPGSASILRICTACYASGGTPKTHWHYAPAYTGETIRLDQ